MNSFRRIAPIALGACVCITGCENTTQPPAPANKAANGGTGTPQTSPSDAVTIVAAIRRAIMEDAGMSATARMCEVVADPGGVVTLRGVVDSPAEKDSIGAKARAVAGVTTVDNQLEIKPG